MLIPGKYEDVSHSIIAIGAWLLNQLRSNNSLRLAYEVSADQTQEITYSAQEITAGLCFLYACGLISLIGDRVVIQEVSTDSPNERLNKLVVGLGTPSVALVQSLHKLLEALRVA